MRIASPVSIANIFILLLFFFPASILIVPGAYNWVAASMVVVSTFTIGFAAIRFDLSLETKKFYAFLLIYPFLLLVLVLFQHGKITAVDYPARVLLTIPIFLVLAHYRMAKKPFLAFVAGIAVGACVAGIIAIQEAGFGSLSRVGSNISNEIPYGQIAAILALFAFVAIKFIPQWHWRTLNFLAACMASIAMQFSGTRGAWLGFIIALIVSLIVMVKWTVRKTIFAIGVFLIAFFAIFFVPNMQLRLLQFRLMEVFQDYESFWQGQKQSSFGIRMQLWQVATDSFEQHPWFGLGPGKFPVLLDQLATAKKIPSYLGDFNHAHSQYFDTLANAGGVGLLALLISFVGPLWLFINKFRLNSGLAQQASLMGCTLIIFTMIASLVQPLYAHNISVIFYLISLTVCWHFSDQSLYSEPKDKEQEN